MSRFRFSLGGLLIVTALLAGLCYWRDRPRQNAKRFVALIEAGDYNAAEAMFDDDLPLGLPLSISSKWRVERLPQSAADWFRGHYPLRLRAELLRSQYYVAPAAAHSTGVTKGDWVVSYIWLEEAPGFAAW